jgi:hypothetical protein
MALKFKNFNLPEKVLNELYELTGKEGAYKGLVLAYASENGEPVIFSKFDSTVVEYALQKALEQYLQENEATLLLDDPEQ